VKNKPQARRALPPDEDKKSRSGGKKGIIVLLSLVILVAGGVGVYFTGLLDPLMERFGLVSTDEDNDAPPAEVFLEQWPLTGKAEQIKPHPAIVMEIENSPATRPLQGIEQADLVVEEAAGEQTTRISAVFHSSMPQHVSPLGNLTATNDPKWPTGFVVWRGESPMAYHPDADAPGPEPLAVFDDGERGTTSVREGFMTSHIMMRLPGGSEPSWEYDINSLSWMRREATEPVVTASGQRVNVANVIIINAEVEQGSSGVVPSVNLVGEGTGYVASGQMVAELTWKRESLASMWQFFDLTGEPVLLTVGSTWIQVIPTGWATVEFD
jgi:hypothetical protein